MNIDASFYQTPKKEWWSGRIDSPEDATQFRYHQVVKCTAVQDMGEENETILLGFASDEGVRRNAGRPGASGGPEAFRKTVSSLAWHGPERGFLDAGNITPHQGDLETGQELLGECIEYLLGRNKKTFLIGGGHETAYGHYLGIARHLGNNTPRVKLGILNIDAHFDLRPHNGLSHSGSPFLQAHEHAADHGLSMNYMVYGINPHNNTQSLFEQAESLGARWVENREVIEQPVKALEKVNSFLNEHDVIYLTICLDVFEAASAPGVSAPAWNGIQLHHALAVLDRVKASGKLISMDVCELNPQYDQDGKTARLAGSLFSEFIG